MFFPKINSPLSIIFSIIVGLSYAKGVLALDPTSDLPIQIESDRATLNDETGISNYAGNVIISQGHIRLEADNISINSIDREITSIKANGKPAHFIQEGSPDESSTHGYGDTIIFISSEGILKFMGNARLVQDNNSFSGEQIEYDIAQKAIRAKGDKSIGSRVKIQYRQPKKVLETNPLPETKPLLETRPINENELNKTPLTPPEPSIQHENP